MSAKEFICTLNIQSLLAVLIVGGGLYVLVFSNPASDVKIAIVGLMSSVVGFYFGSSKSNAKKDETIANIAEQSNTK